MRWIYICGVDFKGGEFEVVRSPSSSLDSGEIRICGPLSRSASVHSLLVDSLKCVDGHHLYLLATVPASGEMVYGFYRDADVDRLSWLIVPSSEVMHGYYPGCFSVDRHLEVFQNRRSNCPLPLDVLTSYNAFTCRRAWLQLSDRMRNVPGVVRHESSYDKYGSAFDGWRQSNDVLRSEAISCDSLGIDHMFLSNKDLKHYQNLYLRPFFSASVIRRIRERITVIRNGVDLDTIDSWLDEWGGFNPIRGRTVGSFSRPSAQKGTREVLSLYQRMASVGHIDKAIVTWNKSVGLDGVLGDKPHECFEFYPSLGRKEYLEKAARCSVFISNSKNESSPFLVAECMAVGAVPILPDREWVLDLPEPWPYVYRDMDEAIELIHGVLDANKNGSCSEMTRDYARRNYNGVTLYNSMVGYMRGVARRENKFESMSDEAFGLWCNGSKFIDNLAKVVRRKRSISWVDMFKGITLPRDVVGGLSLLSHHDLPVILRRRFGFVDDLMSPIPNFMKVD